MIASLHDLEKTEQRNVQHVHKLAEKSQLLFLESYIKVRDEKLAEKSQLLSLESYIKVRDKYNFIQKKEDIHCVFCFFLV